MLAPGMRGAGLGPSGRGHRHRTCRAISAATRPVGASGDGDRKGQEEDEEEGSCLKSSIRAALLCPILVSMCYMPELALALIKNKQQ